MKKIGFYIFITFTFTSALFLAGCEEDENTAALNEPPKIAFSVSQDELIGVNLGQETQPAIVGTAQADEGLQNVTVELLKGSESVVLINETSFDEVSRIIYVFDTIPEYSLDVTGVRVIAVDEQGRELERSLTIETYPNPEIDPAQGLPGTTVTVTGPEFVEEDIESVMIGETEIAEYTVAPDGSSITFEIPEGAEPGEIIINRAGTYPYVSVEEFLVLSDEPKTLNTYTDVTVRGQGVRNDGQPTAFSAQGETFTLAEGAEGETSKDIDFITADSGGDDALDLFAPGNPDWLSGNYFEDSDDNPVEWPTLNVTQMMVIEDAGQAFFEESTMESIQALELTSPTTRVQLAPNEVGVVILFMTAEGEKGLIYYEAHDPMNDGSKGDQFTFDIKVIE